MKRSIILGLAVVLLMFMTSCGKEEEGPPAMDYLPDGLPKEENPANDIAVEWKELEDTLILPATMPEEWRQYFYADQYVVYGDEVLTKGNIKVNSNLEYKIMDIIDSSEVSEDEEEAATEEIETSDVVAPVISEETSSEEETAVEDERTGDLFEEEVESEELAENAMEELAVINLYTDSNLRLEKQREIIIDGALIWDVLLNENFQVLSAELMENPESESNSDFLEKNDKLMDSKTRDFLNLLNSAEYYPEQDAALRETENLFLEMPAENLKKMFAVDFEILNLKMEEMVLSREGEFVPAELTPLVELEIPHAEEIVVLPPAEVDGKRVINIQRGDFYDDNGYKAAVNSAVRYYGTVDENNYTEFTDYRLEPLTQRQVNHMERASGGLIMAGAFTDKNGMGHAQQYLQDGSILEFIISENNPVVVGLWENGKEDFSVIGAITQEGFINTLDLDLSTIPVSDEMNFWITLNYQIRALYLPPAEEKTIRSSAQESTEESSISGNEITIYHALTHRNVIVATGKFFGGQGDKQFYYYGIEPGKRDPNYVGDISAYDSFSIETAPEAEEPPVEDMPVVEENPPQDEPEVAPPKEEKVEETVKKKEEPEGETSSNLSVKTSVGEAKVKFNSPEDLSVEVRGSLKETYFIAEAETYSPIEKNEIKNKVNEGKVPVLIFTDADGNLLTQAIPMSSQWYTFNESWIQKEDGQTVAYFKDVKPNVMEVWEFILCAKRQGGDIPLQIEFFSDFNCTKSIGLADVPVPESDAEFSDFKVSVRLSGVNEKTPVYMIYGENKWRLN